MTITTKFLMGWVAVHVIVWLVTLFVIAVFGFTVPGCTGNRYLCGTPLAANIEWFEQQPDFVLLAVIELFADGFWKLGVLLAMDYPILRYGDGLAGMVGDLFQWIGILAIFAVGISFLYQRFTR